MSYGRKITAGNVVLGTFEDLISDLVPMGEPVIQLVQPYRGTEIAQFERGNVKTTVTFSVEREHETLIAAEKYMWDVGTLAGLYNVTFASRIESSFSRYLRDASISARKESRIGVRTKYNFTVIGGTVRTAP